MKFTVPASIDDATKELVGIEGLVLATEWKRAAVVAAFVTKDSGHGGKPTTSSGFSVSGFAKLGITGLKSIDTVRRYVDAWEQSGQPKPKPGQSVTLPTGPFPTVKTKAQDIAGQPGAVAAALADAAFAAKVAAKATPTAKRNIATATVDQQTLDDPRVKQHMRGQVAKHDVASQELADATRDKSGGGLDGALGKSISALGNESLRKALSEFKSFQHQLANGYVLNDSDAVSISLLLTAVTEVSVNVDLSEFAS